MGYYESVLVSLPMVGENKPSYNKTHLIEFCPFKYMLCDQYVKSSMAHNGKVITCHLGHKFIGSGAWNKLGNIGRFAATILGVHDTRGQGCVYKINCSACDAPFAGDIDAFLQKHDLLSPSLHRNICNTCKPCNQ